MIVQAPTPAEDFGVVIPAQPEHLHWVKGTCASIRHFMGDTPICVLLDGEEFPDGLRRTYGIQVLRPADVEHRELRELSFGSLKAKNTPLWISPFETFFLLDADAIVWGDMRRLADLERFDFIIDNGGSSPERVRNWMMDTDAVARHFPQFDAHRHASDFASNGAYFARRGMLDLDRYLELLRFSRKHPGMFYGSQGLFNFMVFSALDEGALRLNQRELQVTTGRTPREEVVQRMAFVGSRPRVVGDPVVLHWAGSPKPRVRQRGRDYFEPMTFFRLEYRRASHDGRSRATNRFSLRLEDMMCADWRGSNLRGRLGRVRRRSRQLFVRARVALRDRVPDVVVAAVRRRSRSA